MPSIAFRARAGAMLLLAAGVYLAAAPLPGEAQEPDIIGLRGFRELPPAAIQYLAKNVEPTFYIAPPGGTTTDKLLVSRCGDALTLEVKQALANELLALNPKHVRSAAFDAHIDGGISIRVPFCAPVKGAKVVRVTAGTRSLEQTMKTYYPVWGPTTLREVPKLTKSCQGLSLEACSRGLMPGAKVVLPFSAAWVQGAVRPGTTAGEILATLTKLAPAYQENIRKNYTSSSEPLEYVRSLKASDLVSSDRCSEPTKEEEGKWPFDRERVLERLKASRAAYLAKYKTEDQASHVAIIDSGLSEQLFNKLRDGGFFWWNEREKTGEKERDDDGSRIADDMHGIGAGYVTEADFFNFTDADDEQYNHGTKVATAIFGGAAMLDTMVAAKIRPPVAISFLRASFRPGEVGTIRPLPTFVGVAADWLNRQKASVVNLSMSHRDPEAAYKTLYNNTLIVAAAGNDGKDIGYMDAKPYPAAQGGMRVAPILTVGAHDTAFRRLSRSNFGKSHVDLLAPGCAIPVLDAKGAKVYGTGTSYAAPFVSLTAGILRTLGMVEPLEMRNRIVFATDFNIGLKKVVWSSGTLNIAKAISIFEDIVVIRKAGAGPASETLYGELLLDPGVNAKSLLGRFCNDPDKRQLLLTSRFVKVSTYEDKKGNFRLRYLADPYDNPDRTLVEVECGLDVVAATSRPLRFKVQSEGRSEDKHFTIAEVVDVVPRWR